MSRHYRRMYYFWERRLQMAKRELGEISPAILDEWTYRKVQLDLLKSYAFALSFQYKEL